MKVILTRDVKDVGKAGEMVNVSEGYARNFLLPRKLAILADAGAVAALEKKRKTLEIKGEHLLADAKAIAEKIGSMKVTIAGKAGTGTKLYGSVTSQDIADAMLKQHNVKIDKRKIHLSEPIKNVGSYDVPIKLHHDVEAKIHVDVTAQGE